VLSERRDCSVDLRSTMAVGDRRKQFQHFCPRAKLVLYELVTTPASAMPPLLS
jgi:hypothetical protein